MIPVRVTTEDSNYTAPGCEPLPVYQFDKLNVMRWRPSDDERKAIAEGGDVLVVIKSGEVVHPQYVAACNTADIILPDEIRKAFRNL